MEMNLVFLRFMASREFPPDEVKNALEPKVICSRIFFRTLRSKLLCPLKMTLSKKVHNAVHILHNSLLLSIYLYLFD